jgi:RNA polymerase sigma-70 factor (ECF subfamily)
MSGERHDPALGPAPPDAANPACASERTEAISTLFREHNRALVHFLMTRLSNEAEAKEVAQEAYVRLLQLDRPVAVSFLRWYLFKIAKGIAVDRHRQRGSRQRLDQLDVFEDLDTSSPTENSVMAADELALLLSALRELPRKCQQAFLLHRFRDLSTVEVAATMGLTDRMVRKYVQRALVYCRLRIEGLSREEATRQVEP